MANARFSAEVQEALDQIDEICPMATYLSESILTKDDWIDTGNMGLNAIISGSLYGGIPKGRIVQFVGESQCLTGSQLLRVYKMRSLRRGIPKTETIIQELKQFYTSKEVSLLVGVTPKTIKNILTGQRPNKSTRYKFEQFFNAHVSNYSIEATVPDMMGGDSQYVVDSPDGWIYVTDFITKGTQACYKISVGPYSVECSEKHLIQRYNGDWVFAKDLEVGEDVLTKTGRSSVTMKDRIEDQEVYDIGVESDNHRYWSGGISSHNTYKSGFMLQILANAQKKGMTVVIFDTEGAIDGDAAARMGLDVDKVKYINPITIEATRNAVFKFLTWVHQKNLKGQFLIAIDSVANLIPEMEVTRMEKDKTSADMGTFAKAVKSLLRVCNALGTATKTPIVLTNWVYDDPSAMYTSAEKNISGGKSAKYLPSVTVQLRRKLIKDEDVKTADTTLAASQKGYSGVSICAYTTKNRFMKQFLEVELYLSHSTGMDRYYGLLEIMEGMKIVSKKGATYYDWNDEKLGYAKNFIRDVDLMENRLLPELEARIKKEWSYGNLVEEEVEVINSLDDVLVDEEDVVVEEVPLTALDKLKQRKKKLTETLDRMDEEERADIAPEQ